MSDPASPLPIFQLMQLHNDGMITAGEVVTQALDRVPIDGVEEVLKQLPPTLAKDLEVWMTRIDFGKKKNERVLSSGQEWPIPEETKKVVYLWRYNKSVGDVRPVLQNAPAAFLEKSMKPLIERWDDPPKPLQILEVLDYCIHGDLANGIVVSTLQFLYSEACDAFRTTHEEVVKGATWRKQNAKLHH